MRLDQRGLTLLRLLVSHLPNVRPGRPNTYITYGEVHQRLGLKQVGRTYGVSLQHQGLTSLAQWTKAKNLPAIAGLIISGDDLMPGQGYFNDYNKSPADFAWWTDQITQATKVDWSQFIMDPA